MSNIPDNNLPDPHEAALLLTEIIVDEDVSSPVAAERLQTAVATSAAQRGFDRGELCVRVTNDIGIHLINREHLGHDYPTDVISFSYGCTPPHIEGELVVSVDTARARSRELGWSIESELILYVVHGTLHLTGMDDHDPSDRAAMRQAEHEVMTALGIDGIDRFGADSDPSSTKSCKGESPA